MSSTLAAIIMAAVLLICLLAAIFIGNRTDDLIEAFGLGLILIVPLLAGFLITTTVPGNPGSQYGPAGVAVGWSHHSEQLTQVPAGVDVKHLAVITPEGRVVEVDPNTRLRVGATINYSCPPADGRNDSQYRTVPYCKQDTVQITCSQVCPEGSLVSWWAIPMLYVAAGIVLLASSVTYLIGAAFRRRKARRRQRA